MWKRETEGPTRVQSLISFTAHFILIQALTTLFSPLPVWPSMSFYHRYNYFEITEDKPVKKFIAPLETNHLDEVWSIQSALFFLPAGYTYFSNDVYLQFFY